MVYNTLSSQGWLAEAGLRIHPLNLIRIAADESSEACVGKRFPTAAPEIKIESLRPKAVKQKG